MEYHKQGDGGWFTKRAGANKLLYSEEFSSRLEAVKRESQIKGWTRRKKLALINGDLSLLKQLQKLYGGFIDYSLPAGLRGG